MDEEIALVAVEGSAPEAREAMRQYFGELASRFPEGFDPGDAYESAASEFKPPDGVFLVALRGREVVGCGALRSLGPATAEVKRMWIAPACRGRGLGRRLLGRLEAEARDAGCSRVVLDTHGTLAEARALYTSAGYAPTEAYNDNPYAQHWFSKTLGG